jgi:hypothetical protein
MKISYERNSKRVIVAFRGRIMALPESYEDEESGIRAAERHCRLLGWNPEERKKSRNKFFRTM